MQDLLKSQTKDSLKLALPEGLKDLMSDISREVLRAQPKDILGFITHFLSCLLVTRENLHVASKIVDTYCQDVCWEGLEAELGKLDIYKEDIETIKQLVDEYFASASAGKPVNEGVLITKLVRRTSIVLDQVPAIQAAIRKAFIRTQASHGFDMDKITSKYEHPDEVARAVNHTLMLYNASKPSDEEYHQAATKIQTAYRAYGVRREMTDPENKRIYEQATIKTLSKDSEFDLPAMTKRMQSDEVEILDSVKYESTSTFIVNTTTSQEVFSQRPRQRASTDKSITLQNIKELENVAVDNEIINKIDEETEEEYEYEEEDNVFEKALVVDLTETIVEDLDETEEGKDKELVVTFDQVPRILTQENDDTENDTDFNDTEDRETMNVEFENIPELTVRKEVSMEEVEKIAMEEMEYQDQDSLMKLIS